MLAWMWARHYASHDGSKCLVAIRDRHVEALREPRTALGIRDLNDPSFRHDTNLHNRFHGWLSATACKYGTAPRSFKRSPCVDTSLPTQDLLLVERGS